MSKKKTIGQLKKDRWKLMSEYIRLKYSDDNGYVSCVTCGTTKHYKDGIHAGHFEPKAKGNAVYFVEENIHPQCYRCNMNLEGNRTQYYPFMLDMYGQETIDWLAELAKSELKFTRSDHEEAIKDLKQKIKDLE